MDVQVYLDRIDFEDTIALHKNVLFKLQRKHLLNIPFENLDIHYNRKIKLSVPAIYQKIINEKRGGFCYELNGLFHSLLKQIGFDAKLISARVHIKDDDYSPEYDHLAIIVNLENKQFLVDVGFGKFSLEPLKLEMNQTISDSFGKFQFDKFNKEYYRINEVKDTNVLPQYIFKNEERKLSEFSKRCEFHQTSEHSHFTKKKLISIAKTNGRITLNNSQLKITHLENEEEINFDEREFESKLKHYFDIEI
ncbi:arylamine N-acetyltransferase family protein [Maribacter litoralis]|uniref:Acetyltransferase n=1 Tax=Maribacter litoralis TaxID=2059726 RepID=A0A653US73_9FLAO|nr:arylamine N-acetyltransferase [Maribacter litoralis]VXB96587.1 Acetyltransferase [Maribacter litoralis]